MDEASGRSWRSRQAQDERVQTHGSVTEGDVTGATAASGVRQGHGSLGAACILRAGGHVLGPRPSSACAGEGAPGAPGGLRGGGDSGDSEDLTLGPREESCGAVRGQGCAPVPGGESRALLSEEHSTDRDRRGPRPRPAGEGRSRLTRAWHRTSGAEERPRPRPAQRDPQGSAPAPPHPRPGGDADHLEDVLPVVCWDPFLRGKPGGRRAGLLLPCHTA